MDSTQRDEAPDEYEARLRREAERLVRDGFDREVAAGRLERYGVDPETGHYLYRRPAAPENASDPSRQLCGQVERGESGQKTNSSPGVSTCVNR